MNFFENNPNYMNMPMTPPMMNNINNMNNIDYKINELENHLKKLEQRITRLENNKFKNNNYTEPDNSLYMI